MSGYLRSIVTSVRSERGTSLIETTVAAAILLVVMLGLLSMGAVATSHTENHGHLAARTAEYAQDKMEQLRSLAYTDAASDTIAFPAAATGGTGLSIGGSADPTTPVAGYVDYLKQDGSPDPMVGGNPPADWFYKRVWQISSPSANLKQIAVTAIVAHSVARAMPAEATVVSLKSFPF